MYISSTYIFEICWCLDVIRDTLYRNSFDSFLGLYPLGPPAGFISGNKLFQPDSEMLVGQ